MLLHVIKNNLGAVKSKGLNRIAKIGYGHLCLRDESLSLSTFRLRLKTKLNTGLYV